MTRNFLFRMVLLTLTVIGMVACSASAEKESGSGDLTVEEQVPQTEVNEEPVEPTAAPRIDIDALPEEVDAPSQTVEPDYSGEQETLTPVEMAVQDFGLSNYSGTFCRITLDMECSCSEGAATSEVTFGSSNEGIWTINLPDSSATFNIERLGINTWQGFSDIGEGRTFAMELVFFETGFQQTTTIGFPDDTEATCTNIWERE